MNSLSISQIDKIFSNSLRIDIMMHLLSHGQLTLSQITQLTGKSKSAMSRQMKQLIQFDMIDEFEQDFNNPGSPHKAFRISQSFTETFMRIRDQQDFFDIQSTSSYISYLLGMLAVSSRMNELTKQYLQRIEQGERPDGFVDMGIIMVNENDLTYVQQLISKFIEDITSIEKVGPANHLISISLHPFVKLQNKS